MALVVRNNVPEIGLDVVEEGELVLYVVYDTLSENMHLFPTIARCIGVLANGGCARLLIDRHGLTTKECIDGRGFSSVKVAGDQDRGSLSTQVEFVNGTDRCPY